MSSPWIPYLPSASARTLEHDLLTAPVIALHHVGACVVGRVPGVAANCRRWPLSLAVGVRRPGPAEAHAHPLVAALCQAGSTPSLPDL